jgi:hypothetical protein
MSPFFSESKERVRNTGATKLNNGVGSLLNIVCCLRFTLYQGCNLIYISQYYTVSIYKFSLSIYRLMLLLFIKK